MRRGETRRVGIAVAGRAGLGRRKSDDRVRPGAADHIIGIPPVTATTAPDM